jgi:transcriptional regulator NrdR family protein
MCGAATRIINGGRKKLPDCYQRRRSCKNCFYRFDTIEISEDEYDLLKRPAKKSSNA